MIPRLMLDGTHREIGPSYELSRLYVPGEAPFDTAPVPIRIGYDE